MKNITLILTILLTIIFNNAFSQSAEEKGLEIIEKSIALDKNKQWKLNTS